MPGTGAWGDIGQEEGLANPRPWKRTGLEGLRGCAGPAAKDDARDGRVAGD